MALGTCVWAAEPASGGQPAEPGWLCASGRIRYMSRGFQFCCINPSPHMAEGTHPEDPLSEPLVPLRSHCTLCVPDSNSFLQPNHPSLLGGKTAWTHSAQTGSYILTPTSMFLCLELNPTPSLPEVSSIKCFQTLMPLVSFSDWAKLAWDTRASARSCAFSHLVSHLVSHC